MHIISWFCLLWMMCLAVSCTPTRPLYVDQRTGGPGQSDIKRIKSNTTKPPSSSILPELPTDIVAKVGEYLSGQTRARFRASSVSFRDQVSNDMISLYFQHNPELVRVGRFLGSHDLPCTSALALYKFCISKQDVLIPSRFSRLWDCFEAVDLLQLHPLANVRLQVAYKLIDLEFSEFVYFDNIRFTNRELLPMLLDSVEWSQRHRSALLHYAAYRSPLHAHPFFMKMHARFCGIGSAANLTGACLSSLVTYTPFSGPDADPKDTFIAQIRLGHREEWLKIENEQLDLLAMVRSNSDSPDDYRSLIQTFKRYIDAGGLIHLSWFNLNLEDVFPWNWFTPATRYGMELLDLLIDAGLISNGHLDEDIDFILVHLLLYHQAGRPALDDLQVAKMLLSTGAEMEQFVEFAAETKYEFPNTRGLDSRQKLESIPVEILALVRSFTKNKIPIGYCASISADRAKQLVDAGISTVESESLAFKITPEVAGYLLEQGADVNAEDDAENGESVLQERLRWYCDETTKIIIQSESLQVNRLDASGRTPLHTLTQMTLYVTEEDLYCLVEEMSLLLTAGADPKIKDLDGKTALDLLGDTLRSRVLSSHFNFISQPILEGMQLISNAMKGVSSHPD